MNEYYVTLATGLVVICFAFSRQEIPDLLEQDGVADRHEIQSIKRTMKNSEVAHGIDRPWVEQDVSSLQEA